MNYPDYKTQWLLSQPLNEWISLKSVPNVIGFTGIMTAIGHRELEDYGYDIKVNFYVTSFMITKSIIVRKNNFKDAV